MNEKKELALRIADAEGVTRAAQLTGVSERTIYYWRDPEAAAKDKARRHGQRERIAELERQLEDARSLACRLNEWIQQHYPNAPGLDLTTK